MAVQAFEDLADAYEAMIDWPKRLANEEPLYRGLVERVGARSLLDAACGTGHHAAMFHKWGLSVEGADLSGAMIERCRARWGESQNHRWAVRGFDAPMAQGGAFDLAICVGNSLALAADETAAASGVRQLLSAVRAGGAIILHVLNLWRLPDGPCVWQKCRRAALPWGDSLIIKGVHRAGDRGFVNMLVTRLDAGEPALTSECVPFLGLEAGNLQRMARDGGATWTEAYGDYRRAPYRRETSQDLILVAGK